MMKNLTPHAIVVLRADGSVWEIPPSGQVLRLEEVVVPDGEANGVPVVRKELRVSELPPTVEGTLYIVSLAVAQMAGRSDFLVPDDLVRDEGGRVIGCRRFARVAVGG